MRSINMELLALLPALSWKSNALIWQKCSITENKDFSWYWIVFLTEIPKSWVPTKSEPCRKRSLPSLGQDLHLECPSLDPGSAGAQRGPCQGRLGLHHAGHTAEFSQVLVAAGFWPEQDKSSDPVDGPLWTEMFVSCAHSWFLSQSRGGE